MEIAPCEALKPYVKCFWGSVMPYNKQDAGASYNRLIIPDTCMDIIFTVNFTDNRITNSFCTIDDRAYFTHASDNKAEYVSTFAIRFYAWGASFFSDFPFNKTKNSVFSADFYFSGIKNEIEPRLFDAVHIFDRIKIAESCLLSSLNRRRYNHIINDAIGEIVLSQGNINMKKLSAAAFASSRTLERLFDDYIGISPKKLSGLVRYQAVWKDVLTSQNLNLTDLAYKHGYFDESHLLNDFKKYHSIPISEARKYAYENVAFLQYK